MTKRTHIVPTKRKRLVKKSSANWNLDDGAGQTPAGHKKKTSRKKARVLLRYRVAGGIGT